MPRPEVYSTTYNKPYEVNRRRLLFANLPWIIKECAKAGNADESKELEVTLVFPSDMKTRGASLDALGLPDTAILLYRICEKVGVKLTLRSFAAWECDDQFYEGKVGALDGDLKDDLTWYYPNLPPEQARAELEKNELELRGKAIGAEQPRQGEAEESALRGSNLIVIGSPKANKVAANLCDILFYNHGTLGEANFYLLPASSSGNPMQVVRNYAEGDRVRKEAFSEHDAGSIDLGWLQMLRNPWSVEPRFLMQFGGFFQQGTVAANLKLNRILKIFADELPENSNEADWVKVQGIALCSSSDTRMTIGKDEPRKMEDKDDDAYIPAHVVRANVKRPATWFRRAKRNRQLRFPTPPGYEGSVEDNDIEDVQPGAGSGD